MADTTWQALPSTHQTSEPRKVGGPVPAAWREGTLTRAKELEVLCAWALCNNPRGDSRELADGILYHLEAARQAAKGAKLESKRRFWVLRNGPRFERAMSNLDAAEILLLNFASPDYVLGQVPSLLNDVQRHLVSGDPRRQELERIAQRLGMKDSDHPLLKQADGQTLGERKQGNPPGTLVEIREGDPQEAAKEEKKRLEKIVNDERGKIVTALRGARSAALREQLRIRSFSLVLGATVAAMTVLAIGVAVMGYRNPTAVPLCFAPEEAGQPTEVVCPTAHSDPIPSNVPVDGRRLDLAVQQAVRKNDLFLVEVLGLTAAAVAAAVAIRGIRGSSEALHLPVLIAVLKLPMGAVTAFLGLLLMRGQFIPGLSALDSSAQILAWALIFGYAQQLFTRFVDQQGQTVLNSVRAADKVNESSPSSSPP